MAEKRPTRERILDAALELFNAHRFARVTTAQIAKSCGIAEGNLWYHFNDREALLEGLLERFSEQLETRLKMGPSSNNVLADYVSFYLAMAYELSTYRFLYRDQLDYEDQIGRLSDRLPNLYKDTTAQFLSFLITMREQGHLNASDAKLKTTVSVSLVMFRYFAEFSGEAKLVFADRSDMMRQAFRLHLALFEDDLQSHAREFFDTELQLQNYPTYLL